MSLSDANIGATLVERIAALEQISESPDFLSRRFATAEHRRANDLVAEWMKAAGLSVHEDQIGNIIGRYEGIEKAAPAVMMGSHLDTVVMAGKYDGMLGVLCALAAVEHFTAAGQRLPFALEVVGFADEEGVRYHSTYLGSKAITGKLEAKELDRVDADGISMREALKQFGKDPEQLHTAKRPASDLRGFLEVHIEQGPVLERENLAVGVVTSIAGATRLSVELHGEAGHAGTVPMNLRRDALCAAAESICAIERICKADTDLVGTVGRITAEPGASNVIPGHAAFTVDVRSPNNEKRLRAIDEIKQQILSAAAARDVEAQIEQPHAESSIDCDAEISRVMGDVVGRHCSAVQRIPSGAGHDTAAMLEMTPSGMLFVRCKGGISHHPDESIEAEDGVVAVKVLIDTLQEMAKL